MTAAVTPFSLKDAPALIERLLPVQKLSAEAYKEQMANVGKTLTALGSYWKGRKPLILAKACIIGCLLPATDDPARDLEIFEKLMAMDDESFVVRCKRRPKPKEILATLSIARITDYFSVDPDGVLPIVAPVDWAKPEYGTVKVAWRTDLTELERRRLEAQMLPRVSYRQRVDEAQRPEEVMDTVHNHIWDAVNLHLGTRANSFPELVEQLGLMRFGHRPRVADTFCGSGQIPFEAARLGCDVYASDLNPVACMLTWGDFNIVGGSVESREKMASDQDELLCWVQGEIDRLAVEADGKDWRGRAYLYCVEVQCPSSGWMVPLLPSRIVSIDDGAIAELLPDPVGKRYRIEIVTSASTTRLKAAAQGTLRTDGRGQDPYMIHAVNGVEYRTKISTLRGDHQKPGGTSGNKLRQWERTDFKPRSDDLFQERLYAIQWMRPKKKGKGYDFEFRSVTPEDMSREHRIDDFVANHIVDWQAKGWLPDMRIEPGYNTDQPIRERGWTHWHHLFNPRQLLLLGLVNQKSNAFQKLAFAQLVQCDARLSRWDVSGGGRAGVKGVFDNQALNTLYNYGARGSGYAVPILRPNYKSFPLSDAANKSIVCCDCSQTKTQNDVYITDPPYGDAVNFHEILEFFIAWLRKNPPPEFSGWIWDSRRSLAIQGEGEEFRRGMVTAYKRMTECMPDNGIQVIMFTHQSGSIWADMANIVWGLRPASHRRLVCSHRDRQCPA